MTNSLPLEGKIKKKMERELKAIYSVTEDPVLINIWEKKLLEKYSKVIKDL